MVLRDYFRRGSRFLLTTLLTVASASIGYAQTSNGPSVGAVPQGEETQRVICFALYTVQDGVLKLTAQLYPDQAPPDGEVYLEVGDSDEWKRVGAARPVLPGWTAPFRVTKWDASRDVPYRVRVGDESYQGLIRHDPVEKDVIVAAVFTGNSPGPGGGKISKRDVVDNVAKIDPDVLLFTGDQVYNHDHHTEHWIKFGEDFGDIIRNRPTVTIPDDHDVGHPNLWGAGGRACKYDPEGGYLKPVEYVNMVQRQQTSHLPDPYDPTPVEQGITVYYTSLNVGGIDFAIVEDRKFKSGCTDLDIVGKGLGPRPDHIDKPNYDPKEFDLPGLKLLGDRQLAFLRHWAEDWDGAVMKCVMSQTLWSMASNFHSRDKTFYYADFDANGWPQTGRNQAVDLLRRCFAFHVCGDQHLATIVQYGIDDWRDAGFAFCVPSIANLWPRWWAPKSPPVNPVESGLEHTGDYLDGFGNRLTVYAHTNPRETGREPKELHDRMPGFGIVRFDKQQRTIRIECWPRMVDPAGGDAGQYPGWPRTIRQTDNYGRTPAAWLPMIRVTGLTDPVVRIHDATGELVYALRIRGTEFQPWVFAAGEYEITIGEPENNRWQTRRVIASMSADDMTPIVLSF